MKIGVHCGSGHSWHARGGFRLAGVSACGHSPVMQAHQPRSQPALWAGYLQPPAADAPAAVLGECGEPEDHALYS